jgi:hypothetical protein
MTGHPGVIDHARMATSRLRSRGKSGEVPAGAGARLVDDMLDLYVDWREDAAAVADAYTRWSAAPARERAWRFSAYMAALEQEESTARSYAVVVADVDRWLQQAQLRVNLRDQSQVPEPGVGG